MAPDEARIHLLSRVARGAFSTPSPDRPASILALCAAAYGARPLDDATVPTGFDPQAVALFESLVEGAYLVARADGVFDAEERSAFERVVTSACGGCVSPRQIEALVKDLEDQLQEDGVDARVSAVAGPVSKKEHAHEIIRIAALLGDASEGISDVERATLDKLALGCGLSKGDVDAAIAEVRAALTRSA